MTPSEVFEEEEYTVFINGAVETSMCPVTGADKCILPAMAVQQVRGTGRTLETKKLEQAVPVIGVGGKVTLSHETAQIDLQIRTSTGPVNKLDCLIVERENQFLLSKSVMMRLGIDIKRAFEQLANTIIDLNNDNIPEDPDVGDVVQEEIDRETKRMCNEVKKVLSDEQYVDFRADVIKLSKTFTHCTGLGLARALQLASSFWS
ncbi:hypothetical protein V7S43_000102 [Phytophthora oleae]|uniref:Uncharacterized protein n=1 Tax=Phytophthora oleae TaxID=2107226 RepID=A0ABD3G804_9STRA